MDYYSYRCPHCGKELQVPKDAEHIVCMFCAKPIDIKKSGDKEQAICSQNLAEAENALSDEVFSFRIELNNMSRKTYPVLFETYRRIFEPSLQCFRTAALSDKDLAVEVFSDLLYKGFLQQIQNKKAPAGSFDCRFTMTSLTIPCILEQKTDAADQLADRFLEKWNAKYPKHTLGKATYEMIENGFKKKLCFITTAVCASLQKGDSCPELTAFREFRDGWLKQTPLGPSKITEYYLYAPIIVEAIERSGQKTSVYRNIWDRYLTPCLDSLHTGDNLKCYRLYEAMMRNLETDWLSKRKPDGFPARQL